VTGDDDESLPARGDSRLRVRSLGVLGWLFAVGLQLPLLIPIFRNGLDYSPGRTGLVTTWATLLVLFDVVVLLWWFGQRSPRATRAALPGIVAVVLAFPLLFVALALRVIVRKILYFL
jgi:hypothetical protein